MLYSKLLRSGHHHALDRVGQSIRDLAGLGPLATRYQEQDVHDILGREHSLPDAVVNPRIARLMAPFHWASIPAPAIPEETPAPCCSFFARRGSNLRRMIRLGGTAN